MTCCRPDFRTHRDAGAAAKSLSRIVAAELERVLRKKNRATVAVPGGRTPVLFFRVLRSEPVDWSKVTITLTDERCVEAGHPNSNQGLIERELLVGAAAQGKFEGLLPDPNGNEMDIGDVEQRVRRHVLPIDVLVLGMGADGHVASLFPGDPGSAAALDPDGRRLLAATCAPGIASRRISLTLAAIRDAGRLFLLFSGADKLAIWRKAESERTSSTLPVAKLIDRAGAAVECHFFPVDR